MPAWFAGTLHASAPLQPLSWRCLQVLAEELPLLLATLNFKRSMRWRGNTAYSRPLRWLMALHGSTALPFSYAGMNAAAVTRLLRNSQDPICQVGTLLSLLCLLNPVRTIHSLLHLPGKIHLSCAYTSC